MRIKFTKETTLDLFYKLNFVEDLSEIPHQYSFGRGLEITYICLNSIDPEIGSWKDFETGLVVKKKYTKSKKTLEFTYKLNHKQMTEAQTRKEVLDIILEGFKKTNNEIKALNIKDFDVDKFYSVVTSVIEDFTKKNDYPPKERLIAVHTEEKKELPKEIKMNEVIFWEIIEQSKEERKVFEDQAQILLDKVSQLSEKEIVGFEFTFREMLAKSYHYNLLAAAKIIEGYVNDDSFLYFRCRLLAEGKEFYFKIIENPDNLADIPILDTDGELMLYIADKAFIKKVGENTDMELPREAAMTFMNYDEVEELSGESWKEYDLPQKYPKLWEKYRKESLA
jgi:hypothetical protein